MAKDKSKAAVKDGEPPKPFRRAPEELNIFYDQLEKEHIYVVHIDSKPWQFKRKVFAVPVLMNIVVLALLGWRGYVVLPWYLDLLVAVLGYGGPLAVDTADMTWPQLLWLTASRGFTFVVDFVLFTFVWPWPFEFTLGHKYSNPVAWRLTVGFRDKELYVRRSREWDTQLGGDIVASTEARTALLAQVRTATSPLLTQDKTGYLTMNGQWDLDWQAMQDATLIVDKKALALDAFRNLVLVHHDEFGWMTVDLGLGDNAKEDERRRQVFAFRDALAALGKENLFYRWIEIVQFESGQPGGFGPEKQAEAAKKIRELFAEDGIDFDNFWKESVGTEAAAGIS